MTTVDTPGLVMKKIIIVAMTEDRCIGKDGALPWHFSADLRRFKEETTGHAVIMGRKTFESIGEPLPNRHNFVLSRKEPPLTRGRTYRTCASLESAFGIAKNFHGSDKAFVIGGAEIYKLAMPFVDEIKVTMIPGTYEGDTYFPEWDCDEWAILEQEQGPDSLKFLTYTKL